MNKSLAVITEVKTSEYPLLLFWVVGAKISIFLKLAPIKNKKSGFCLVLFFFFRNFAPDYWRRIVLVSEESWKSALIISTLWKTK